MEPEHQHDWICKPGQRPESDDGYFENMCRTIFQAGLSWKMIDNKWPHFRRAFANFSVDKVAAFGMDDLSRLLQDRDIVRNERKITATLTNALELQKIRHEFGSFAHYLDSLDKGNNYAAGTKELTRRFKHLGKTTAFFFLYSVGEPVQHEG